MQVVQKRRSYRKFTSVPFPDEAVKAAISAAVIAPNSSNTQTWDFHWVKSESVKAKVTTACLSQSAARHASHLIVVTANPSKWKRSQGPLVKWAEDSKAHPAVLTYYKRLVPFVYRTGPFNFYAPFKVALSLLVGLFRPIMRGPFTRRDHEEVAIKSAALACENFVLAVVDQGGATCMMEGFDEWRVKKALSLKFSDRVVMVIAVGYPDDGGLWGSQFRLPLDQVLHVH